MSAVSAIASPPALRRAAASGSVRSPGAGEPRAQVAVGGLGDDDDVRAVLGQRLAEAPRSGIQPA